MAEKGQKYLASRRIGDLRNMVCWSMLGKP